MIKKIFVFVLLLSSSILSQVENSNKNDDPNLSLPVFNHEILSFANPDTTFTRVDVFIQLPFNVLRFVKNNDVFRSEYSIQISVYDKDNSKLIMEKMWNEKIETRDFNKTNSRNNYNLSLRSFLLQQGSYKFHIEVEDNDSRKKYKTISDVNVRTYEKDFSVSDVVILENKESKGNEIYPNISRNISSPSKAIPLFFEVITDTAMMVNIKASVTNKNNEEVYSSTGDRQITTGKNQIFYLLDSISLGLGDYNLSIQVSSLIKNKTLSITKNFFSRIVGIPNSIQDLDKAIAQMTYIASEEEMDKINSASTSDEKFQRFIEFWKKKRPASTLEDNEVFNEYYRRVDYANKYFSTRQEGWRTDMGMVYIILGPPNNVERHPFEYDSKPYEIWEYFDINKQFVFVDYTGFGDYRLVSPYYGDIYRYRR